MTKTDTLTVSRVFRVLSKHGLDDIACSENMLLSTMAMANMNDGIVDELMIALDVEDNNGLNGAIEIISDFLAEVSKNMELYTEEISKRKHHVSEILKLWIEDEPKHEENKDYKTDYYLQCYVNLSKEGIAPEKLNLYESLIIHEEIVCNQIRENVHQMLSMLEDKHKTFCLIFQKENLKHANFIAFMLDIYNEVEKMYNEMNEKERNKK